MRVPFLFAGALFLGSCSTQTFERVECVDNVQCRDTFGLGTTCGDEGYCEVAELHPRCTTLYPSDLTLPIDPETTLVVGSVFDHSLDTHIGRYQSAQLAAIQANANDGLETRQFAMIHCNNSEVEGAFDDGLDKTAASVDTATWLAQTVGVPAIIGPAASSRTEAVYNAISEAEDVLIVSPSATSPSLTPLDGTESTGASPGLLWRTAPPDDLQAVAIARDMREAYADNQDGLTAYRPAPAENVAVIHQTGAYGDGLQAAFSAAFSDLGGTSTAFPFDDETGRADAIALAANGGFDEVLFVSSDSEDIVAFLQGASTLANLADMPIFLPDAGRNSDVLDDAAGASELFDHIRGTAPANPAGPVYDSFQVSYAAEYGGADVSVLSFTAQSFDAMWLVIYGHAWALYQQDGNISGTPIARGLRQVSNGDAVDIRPNNWNLVKASFENGESIDVFGASGTLDYAPNGETSATIEVWTITPDNSGFEVVDTVDP